MENIDINNIMTGLVHMLLIDRHDPNAPKVVTAAGHEEVDAWKYTMRSVRSLVFFVSLDVQHHGYSKDGTTYNPAWKRHAGRDLIFIMTQRHNVFLGQRKDGPRVGGVVNSNYLQTHLDEFSFENLSNHDSAWRESLSVFTHIMDLYKQTHDHVPQKHRVAPSGCSLLTQFGPRISSGVPSFEFAAVDMDYDEDRNTDGSRYWRRLTGLEFYDQTITLTKRQVVQKKLVNERPLSALELRDM